MIRKIMNSSNRLIVIKYLVVLIILSQAIEAYSQLGDANGSDRPGSRLRYTDQINLGIEGENIDIRTGGVYWEVNDIKLPGTAGQDLSIFRSWNKDSSLSHRGFANWDIELPRIQLSGPARDFETNIQSSPKWGAHEGKRTYCSNPTQGTLTEFDWDTPYEECFDFDGDGIADDCYPISDNGYVQWTKGLTLFIPGEGPKKLLRKTSNEDHPQISVQYVTTDNWIVDCVDPADPNEQEMFIVISPNGTHYQLDVYGFEDGSLDGPPTETLRELNLGGAGDDLTGRDEKVTIYASTQTDRFGNSVNYEFTTFTSNEGRWGSEIIQPLLESVSSDDGLIEIQYTNHNTPFIDKIVVNGEEWNYEYSQDGNYLSQVILPDGSSWEYDYQGPNFPIQVPLLASTDHYKNRQYLSEVISPTGLEINYGIEMESNYYGTMGVYATRYDSEDGEQDIWTTFSSNCGIDDNVGLVQSCFTIRSPDTVLPPNKIRYFPIIKSRQSSSTDTPTTVVYFEFARGGENNVTNLTGDRNERHEFSTDKDILGSLLNKTVYDDQGEIVEVEALEWNVLPRLGDDFMRNAYVPDSRSLEKKRVLMNRVLNRSTHPNIEFHTSYTDYDLFGYPQKIVQEGTKSRRQDITYKHFTNYDTDGEWVVGLAEDSFFYDNSDENSPALLGSIDQTFNNLGLLTSVDNFGISESFEYYSTGDLKKRKFKQKTTDPFIEVEYKNYKMGQARLEEFPENISVSRVINDFGRIDSETDADGVIRSFEYDELGRVTLTSIAEEADEVAVWETSRIQKITKGDYRENNTFDSFGRLILSEKYDINQPSVKIYTKAAYDKYGRKSFESLPSSISTETKGIATTYDILGRIKSTTDTVLNAVTNYYYGSEWSGQSEAGDPSIPSLGFGVVDGRGYKKVYEQDAFGDPKTTVPWRIHEQVSQYSASESTVNKYILTEITQNALGKMTKVSQGGLDRVYNYSITRPNLLENIVHPETGTTTFTYDNIGNIETKKVGSASAISYDYDKLNRVELIDYPAGTDDIEFEYFGSGKLKSIDNSLSHWDYTYTPAGKLKTESLSVVGDQFDLSYNYSLEGDLSSTTYPNGEVVSFSPDGLGRAQKVGKYVTNVSHHPDGFIASFKYQNEHTTYIDQNPKGLIEEIRSGVGTNYSMRHSYLYDSNDNVTVQSNLLNSSSSLYLTYDGINRLKTANSVSWGGTQSFNYDDVGNILSKSIGASSIVYTYNSTSNKLQSVTGGYSFNYDAYGNVTNNGKNTFIYDDAGRMTSVSSSPVIEYIYDGHGRRVGVTKSNSSADVDYFAIYNRSGQLVHRKDAETGNTTNYYYLGHRLAATTLDCSANDADGDSIPDCVEDAWGLDKNNADDAQGDLDGDGLLNIYEYAFDLNPKSSDTDNDGLDDLYEVQNNVAGAYDGDLDGDGLSDYLEFLANADPLNTDTDGDGIPDGIDSNPTLNIGVLVAILSTLLN